MNTSLYFKNLTDEEILQILNVISVPCLMEPLKKQPQRYLGKGHKGQSLSREAVNHIYLKFLKANDLVLSLYLSDLVVDIIHFFKLSDGFKRLLTTDDPAYPEKLAKKIQKRHCPITVNMFMRLLDAHYQPEPEQPSYDIEIEEIAPIKQETVSVDQPVVQKTEDDPIDESVIDEFENSDFFDVLPEVTIGDEPSVAPEPVSSMPMTEPETEIEVPDLDFMVEGETQSTEANPEALSLEAMLPEAEAESLPLEATLPEADNDKDEKTEDVIIEMPNLNEAEEASLPEMEAANIALDVEQDGEEVPEQPEFIQEEPIEEADVMSSQESQSETLSVENAEMTEASSEEPHGEEVPEQPEFIQEEPIEEADVMSSQESQSETLSVENAEMTEASSEEPQVVFEEKNEDALIGDDQKIEQLEKEISSLQYQIMSLQMENESLKDENRDLLFQGEDESEKESLRQDIHSLEEDNAHLKEDMANLTSRNQELEKELVDYQTAKENENQMRLELRDYKIKYISLQSEYDQLQYKLKNDNKRLKELENKQRTIHESKEDLMMALHDLNWYKKQWHLPGDAPIHQIWAHLNNVESQKLKDLMKKYDRLVKSEKQEQVEGLKEILLVKEAILILLKANRSAKNKNENTESPF